jgi:hypothetical protein
MPEIVSNSRELKGRGGKGGVFLGGVLYFPVWDGKGCNPCGAVYPGGHGGNCPQGRHFDENGDEVIALPLL